MIVPVTVNELLSVSEPVPLIVKLPPLIINPLLKVLIAAIVCAAVDSAAAEVAAFTDDTVDVGVFDSGLSKLLMLVLMINLLTWVMLLTVIAAVDSDDVDMETMDMGTALFIHLIYGCG